MPHEPATPEALALLFTEARTHRAWDGRPVPDDLLRRMYELARLPPTGGNTSPGRFVFVKTKEAKERLRPALDQGNVEKTMTAPVTAIVAHDLEFYEQMDKLAPGRDMRTSLASMPAEKREWSAFLNGVLEGAYLILAARALGLDCGPMGGFDRGKVDAAFFPDGKWKSSFLVNIGYGDASKLGPRGPRLEFGDACRIE
jgi:3-hydroxypropanoate dehydrogenase